MTSTQVACGAFLLFVFALVWSMVRENNKRKKKFLEKIKKSWGAVPTREYSWDELEQISAYHKAQPKNSFVIDEITWNDLDMNRIFMLMNQTVSSAGEDYLYAMLHRPEFSEERLKERERLFCFFEKEEKICLWICNEVTNPEEIDVSKVFQRFYKADGARSKNSSGLGLSIAQEFVLRMKGEIHAELSGNEFWVKVSFPQKNSNL